MIVQMLKLILILIFCLISIFGRTGTNSFGVHMKALKIPMRKEFRQEKMWRKTYTIKVNASKRYLLLLLLLAGDVEANPGPISCPRWNQVFDRQSRLNNHLSKQQPLRCGHCDRKFCSENQVHQHIRTEHIGSGIGADPPTQPPTNMSAPIFGTTGYENEAGYLEMLNEHESVIRTQTHNRTDWMKKNIQIQPDFCYADLRSILDEVMTSENGKVFKLSLIHISEPTRPY